MVLRCGTTTLTGIPKPVAVRRGALLNTKKSFEKIFRYFEEWEHNIEEQERAWDSWQATPDGMYLDYLKALIAYWHIRDL